MLAKATYTAYGRTFPGRCPDDSSCSGGWVASCSSTCSSGGTRTSSTSSSRDTVYFVGPLMDTACAFGAEVPSRGSATFAAARPRTMKSRTSSSSPGRIAQATVAAHDAISGPSADAYGSPVPLTIEVSGDSGGFETLFLIAFAVVGVLVIAGFAFVAYAAIRSARAARRAEIGRAHV